MMGGCTDFSDGRVAVSRVHDYDVDRICAVIRQHFALLGISPASFRGKTAAVKPNIVSDKGPDGATTTHPAIVQAAVRVLRESGADVIIAESSSGPYTEQHLREIYRSAQFYDAAIAEGASFNFDLSEVSVPAPDAHVCRRFSLIRPLMDADLIVNLCKLKTHSLTKMTCAVKNFYGAIPGLQKMELHARYAQAELFSEMLVDLCEVICQNKPVITICDAVMAMEGEGPGTGDPRWLYAVLTSCNPFALDLAAAELVGYGDTVLTIPPAKERRLCPESFGGLEILGRAADRAGYFNETGSDAAACGGGGAAADGPFDAAACGDDGAAAAGVSDAAACGAAVFEALRVDNFVAPQSQGVTKWLKYVPDFMKPHPVIARDVCVGCGICARSCPRETIRIENGKAHITAKNCIRCFCCQELCPQKAVRVKKSVIFKLMH